MNHEKNCYLVINGKRVGPLSEQDVKNLYAQKKIDENTKFARAGDKEWSPVSMSGIITPPDTGDGLPPLPPEIKPSGGLVKKIFLRLIAAGLIVVVVAFILDEMDTKAPANDAASSRSDSQALDGTAPDESVPSDLPDENGTQDIAAGEENDSPLWTIKNIVTETEIGDGIYVQGVFDAALLENVNYDLHLSESLEKIAEETFEINIYDTKGMDNAGRIADIGLIEIRPVGFNFQGLGSALEHEYPMTVTVEGVTSEFELQGSFASTYVLVSGEEMFINYLYEGKKMLIEIPFSRYRYSFTVDGTGFQHAYDAFRLQAGMQPN